MGIVKMAGWKAHAGTYHVHDLFQILFRGLIVDTAGQRRLIDLHMAHRVHEQVGQFIGGIPSFPGHSAHTHVDKGLVTRKELGAAFAGDPHHLRHLDQHTARQFKGLEIVQASAVNIPLIIGIHILVHTADGHTGLVLLHHQKGLNGPYCLYRLPEGLRLMGGNTGIDPGYFQQFSFSLGI